jgi:PAS domain S-box-containing protein
VSPRQTRPSDRATKESTSVQRVQAPVDILMVDDHVDNLLALEGILKSPQYNLVSVGSGRAALKQLLDREFALILLDVMMPDMDGFETAELIRAREQSRHTPIIFLTAIDQLQGDETRGYAAGAVDFLFKPLNPDILRSKVRAFVDLFLKGRELQARGEKIRARELEEHRRKLEVVQTQRDRFFSLSSDMMVVLDKDGIIRDASLASEKTLGVPARELRGTALADLFQASNRKQILSALQALQEGRSFVTLEASHRTPAGGLRWLSWTLLSFPNEPGGYIVARDITDRVRASRQLEDFFENAPVGSHWIGPDGILQRANRAELELLGYPLEEYVGRSIREFHVDASVADRLLVRLQAGETIRDLASRLRCKDGSFKEVLIDANALIEDGRFIHSRGFLRDVTAQRQAERRQAVSYGVTRILAEARDFPEAAPRLLNDLGGVFGWDCGAAWRIEGDPPLLRCIATWEGGPPGAPRFVTATRKAVFARGTGLPGQVWESRRVLWCPTLTAQANMARREELQQEGLRQGLLIPLLVGEVVLGVIEFYGRGDAPEEEPLISLVGALGSQIGQFIERKRAEDELAKHSRRMIRHQAALLEMAPGDLGDLSSGLTRITEMTARTLGVERVGLWFWDPDPAALVCGDQFRLLTGMHEEGERIEAPWVAGYVGQVEEARVLAIEDMARDPRSSEQLKDSLTPQGISSTMDVAIRRRGKTVAVLRIAHEGDPRMWIPEEQDFASSVADRVLLCLSEIERRKDEEEIRRLNAGLEARVHERTVQLTEALEEQEQFAYSVSHDLRAPLRAMSGFSQALHEDYAGVLDEMGREYARRIMDATDRMDALIKDLLAYSRLSRAEIRLEEVNLGKLVSDVLAQFEVERAERKAVVDVDGPLLPVRGNALALTQVVLNLVSNGLKFVDKEVAPRLRISTQERGDKVRLWVKDNGIGILPEHQDRIFRIFERLNRAEQFPGTGIGLAMVRKALSRMDGSCGVESDGKTGCRFWIELNKA